VAATARGHATLHDVLAAERNETAWIGRAEWNTSSILVGAFIPAKQHFTSGLISE
jgi:hypothetical protein